MWISYGVDKPPTEDPLMKTLDRPWAAAANSPNYTATPGAFKTYNTLVLLITWSSAMRYLTVS